MGNGLGFVDPTLPERKNRIKPAARPADLAGKVIGLLDNRKEQGDVILQVVGEVLRERYGVARIVSRRKEHHSKPAAAALIDEMAREVQVAVAALGG